MSADNYLAKIFEQKRQRVAEAVRQTPLEKVREHALATRSETKPHAFRDALSMQDRLNVIAEFKRASPSKGMIRPEVSAGEMVRLYEQGGAAAISVLTEQDHFLGSLGDLVEARANTRLPILRKDFIFDEYQVFEAAASGAEALLLIASMLDDEQLAGLRRLTEEACGMDALIEVHTADEMRRAERAGASLIGVNNRDLKTFRVALETSFELAAAAPAQAILVSESGITNASEMKRLKDVGFSAFLIGETLMKSKQPDETLRSLLAV